MATLNKFRSDGANNFTPAPEFFGLNPVVLEGVRCDFIATSLIFFFLTAAVECTRFGPKIK